MTIRDKQFEMRVTQEELDLLKDVADAFGISAAEYVRQTAFETARLTTKMLGKKCPTCGRRSRVFILSSEKANP
jgi:hypothetical protein